MEEFQVVEFNPQSKGSLVAKISLKIPKWGNLIIHEICYFAKDEKRWISFPNRCLKDDNEIKWYPLIQFESDKMMKFFSEKTLSAIDEYLKN